MSATEQGVAAVFAIVMIYAAIQYLVAKLDERDQEPTPVRESAKLRRAADQAIDLTGGQR